MGALCCRPEEIDFDAPVDLWHFYLLRSVGKGAFGKVRVVQHKQTKSLYALKYINKARISKQRAVQNIIQERRLLEEIDCPFVCNLRYAFQDDENLFMVLDLMLGGDLRFHLDRIGLFSQERVRFYVMEIALALDYLHERGIVHRDIKPDNVLLDEKGHAHLTDFNIAVHFTERKPLTSIAGSMAYMAPEILAKRGYFATIDWWSLGVVAYELVYGKRPFKGKTNSSLTQSILKESLKFADVQDVARDGIGGERITPETASCLRGFLERDIHKRLGTKHAGGIATLKRHPWFKGMDWGAVERKEVTPPFEPDSKKANFDATHELEELLLEDNPLKAKKRNPNIDINQMSADYRAMEQNFHLYDFTKMQRKSWFNLDAQSTGKFTNELATTSTATSNSLVPLDDQPMAEMTSRIHHADRSPSPQSRGLNRHGELGSFQETIVDHQSSFRRFGNGARTPSPLPSDPPSPTRSTHSIATLNRPPDQSRYPPNQLQSSHHLHIPSVPPTRPIPAAAPENNETVRTMREWELQRAKEGSEEGSLKVNANGFGFDGTKIAVSDPGHAHPRSRTLPPGTEQWEAGRGTVVGGRLEGGRRPVMTGQPRAKSAYYS